MRNIISTKQTSLQNVPVPWTPVSPGDWSTKQAKSPKTVFWTRKHEAVKIHHFDRFWQKMVCEKMSQKTFMKVTCKGKGGKICRLSLHFSSLLFQPVGYLYTTHKIHKIQVLFKCDSCLCVRCRAKESFDDPTGKKSHSRECRQEIEKLREGMRRKKKNWPQYWSHTHTLLQTHTHTHKWMFLPRMPELLKWWV